MEVMFNWEREIKNKKKFLSHSILIHTKIKLCLTSIKNFLNTWNTISISDRAIRLGM